VIFAGEEEAGRELYLLISVVSIFISHHS